MGMAELRLRVEFHVPVSVAFRFRWLSARDGGLEPATSVSPRAAIVVAKPIAEVVAAVESFTRFRV
jgi:hypothetical protein